MDEGLSGNHYRVATLPKLYLTTIESSFIVRIRYDNTKRDFREVRSTDRRNLIIDKPRLLKNLV